MSLSAAIMAHPTRRAQVDQLLVRLDRPVPVYYDPDPQPAADPQRVWETCARAWRLVDPDARWGLVLQDDVIACRDLLAGVERALRQLPAEAVASLYMLGHRYIRTTGIDGMPDGTWMRQSRLVSGQAICVPTREIAGMIAWCQPERHTGWDDYRISSYFRTVRGWPAYFTVPSLVNHPPDGSLLGNRDGRVAYRFVGTERSALDIDWRLHV